jgi:hypothetical protein
MTSPRQIEANRQNALRSTGPKTEEGKQQSRRNALRHGFTAETVIEPLEHAEEYRAFEDAIVSEYLPRTPVEQELVYRLASLFWRLRRATLIDTGLLRIQSEILQAFRCSRQNTAPPAVERETRPASAGADGEIGPGHVCDALDAQEYPVQGAARPLAKASRDVALSFLRLANLDNDVVVRLSRYEAALWRQLAQTLLMLQTLKRR